MTWRLGLVLSLLVVAAISGCGDSAGAEESVVVRTAREDYVEIRSLLTGGDAQSWWADLRGSRMSMGLWVVAEDTDGEPPVLLLGPERDGPAEVTLRLDEAFVWEGAVGDEVVVSGVARTLRLNPFHLVMDEGIAQPTKRSSKAREAESRDRSSGDDGEPSGEAESDEDVYRNRAWIGRRSFGECNRDCAVIPGWVAPAGAWVCRGYSQQPSAGLPSTALAGAIRRLQPQARRFTPAPLPLGTGWPRILAEKVFELDAFVGFFVAVFDDDWGVER